MARVSTDNTQKNMLTPDVLSSSFAHCEATWYWIVRVISFVCTNPKLTFPIIARFLAFAPLLIAVLHVQVTGTLTVQDIPDVTHPENAPVQDNRSNISHLFHSQSRPRCSCSSAEDT